MSICKGDILVSLETLDGGLWTRGRNYHQGQVGIFPTSFTWKLDTELLFGHKSAGKVEKFAQVVHSMQALLDQEMDLVQGEIIKGKINIPRIGKYLRKILNFRFADFLLLMIDTSEDFTKLVAD